MSGAGAGAENSEMVGSDKPGYNSNYPPILGVLCGLLQVDERAGQEHHPAGGGEPAPAHRGCLQAGHHQAFPEVEPNTGILKAFNG